MTVRTILTLVPLAWILVTGASAQDLTFSASVDKNIVAAGEQFTLTFTLTGSSGGQGFRPPSLADFLVASGPNESTSMSIINGSVSSSISYGYILQARAEGKFTVGPATIQAGGRQLSSQPVTITVSKGAPQAKKQSGGYSDTDVGRQIGDNLFLKVTLDKTRVYQGEQVTATYKIYTRVSVANYAISKTPSLTGFWSEDLDIPKQVQLTTEVVNGRQYRVGILKKVALFPQRSGTLSVDPMEVECVVQVQTRRRSNDLFDQFFNDPFFGNFSNVNYKVRNEPEKVTVQPLPPDAPQGFSGAVGKYTVEAWLDKQQVKTNDPVTLRVKISGTGNLKLLEAPQVVLPSDVERYDPKISDNIATQGDRIGGSRTFEFLMIPRHAGELKIPSFPFSFYDVEKRNYQTFHSPEFTMNVAKGAEIVSSSAEGISKEDVKLLGEDIRFIKSGDVPLHRIGERFVGSPAFFALSVGPFVAFFGFLVYVRRRERVMGNVVMLRNRKARKIALRRLDAAKKFLDGKMREEFYAEISRALWGYIGDKLGIPPADLSIEGVSTTLRGRSVPEDSVARLAATIERCEFERFAPSADSARMDDVYHGAVDLISSIEDHLR